VDAPFHPGLVANHPGLKLAGLDLEFAQGLLQGLEKGLAAPPIPSSTNSLASSLVQRANGQKSGDCGPARPPSKRK
jgi:hypothetical protein